MEKETERRMSLKNGEGHCEMLSSGHGMAVSLRSCGPVPRLGAVGSCKCWGIQNQVSLGVWPLVGC